MASRLRSEDWDSPGDRGARPITGPRAPRYETLRALAEHQALATVADRLTQLAAGSGPVVRFGESSRLDEELHLFARRLRTHFELEERGEYLGEVIAACPWRRDDVDRLRAEHDAMRADIDALLDVDAGVDVGADLLARVERLIAAFRCHEAAETALMQDAMLTDVGGDG